MVGPAEIARDRVPRPVALAMAPELPSEELLANVSGPAVALSKLPLLLVSKTPLVTEASLLMVRRPALAKRTGEPEAEEAPSPRNAQSPVTEERLKVEVSCMASVPLM